jgi:uncharacterized protein YuzE
MKISYDSEVDALSITFVDTTVTTKYLDKGVIADYGPTGQLVGLEILSVSKRIGGINTLAQITIEGFGLSFPHQGG